LTRRFALAVTMLWLAACCLSQAQTLTNLTHQAPDGAQLTFQLTDGTVLAQGYNDSDWWKLTPDINGSYVNGTWTQVASLPAGYSPEAFASATLADGRVLIEGGEYNFGQFVLTSLGAVYDPAANTWTALTPPTGWEYIGDSPSTILFNGDFLIGRKLDMEMAELDPATMVWTAMSSSGKSDWFAEEGWTLMPDGTVLTADVLNNPNSERYILSEQQWISDGSTIANLQGPPRSAVSNMAAVNIVRRERSAPLFCGLTRACSPPALPTPERLQLTPRSIILGRVRLIRALGLRGRISQWRSVGRQLRRPADRRQGARAGQLGPALRIRRDEFDPNFARR